MAEITYRPSAEPQIHGARSLNRWLEQEAGTTPPREATQSLSEAQLNQLNGWMRAQPWYQQWFRTKGLNPNYVKLNDTQRRQLSQEAARNGVALGDRMKFDEAGNINQQGGWAGLPTWAKVAIGTGVAAASFGLIPDVPGIPGLTIPGLGGGGGVGAYGPGQGLSAAGTFAAQQIPQAVGAAPTFLSSGGAALLPTLTTPTGAPIVAVNAPAAGGSASFGGGYGG